MGFYCPNWWGLVATDFVCRQMRFKKSERCYRLAWYALVSLLCVSKGSRGVLRNVVQAGRVLIASLELVELLVIVWSMLQIRRVDIR